MKLQAAVEFVVVVFICSRTFGGAVTFGSGASSFAMEFVGIGNPGNAADLSGTPHGAGDVAYSFGMGKYEVSTGMLASANAQGNLGITYDNRSAESPATGVTWYEAAQFVNWLNTSSGFRPAYKFEGDLFQLWSPGDDGYNSANRYRNSRARYVLPSSNEWYKAAYHQAAAGTAGTYFDYATGSDIQPTSVNGGVSPFSAVYGQADDAGPAAATNAGGASSYGTVGQSGNVFEWEETDEDLVNDSSSFRGYRGGAWNSGADSLSSLRRFSARPIRESDFLGFRVARLGGPDINADGTVDAADAAIMFGHWGSPGDGDLNVDDVIDASDAGILFGEWDGDAAPPAGVPEPRGAILTWLAGLFVWRGRSVRSR